MQYQSIENQESTEEHTTSSKTTRRLVATIVVSVLVVCALVASNGKTKLTMKNASTTAALGKHTALEMVAGDTGYVKITGSFTGDEARQVCSSRGMMLASIHSSSETTAAVSACGSTNWCWVGLRRISGNTWGWTDGSAMDYTKWRPGEPNNAGGDENCVALFPEGNWNDAACTTHRGSVLCKPAGYVKITGSFTGDEAKQVCASHGMVVASIHSSSETTAAVSVCGSTNWCWIGLRRISGNSWGWTDQSAMDYTKWRPGEPNNAGGDENCVALFPEGGWNDAACTTHRGSVLCKQGAEQKFFISRTARDFQGAKDACAQAGGVLASIHSAEENEMATKLCFDSGLQNIGGCWLGLDDLRVDGTWVWLDNTPLDYLNWHPGEPNGKTNENCGHIANSLPPNVGKWNDLACHAKLYPMCERRS